MVALKAGAVDAFLKRPDPGITAVLVYGPDRGLVSERTRTLLSHFAADPADPFSVSVLDEAEIAASPDRLLEELNAVAFGAGGRTVLLRTSASSPPIFVAEALSAPRSGVLLVEAGDLRPAAPVRKAFEAARDAAALPCYADTARTLSDLLDTVMASRNQSISAEARQTCLQRLGGDRLASRGEIEKLSLYAGEGAKITLADVDAATADATELTLDALVDSVGEGDVGAVELALERAAHAGTAPAQLVSALVRHFCRLHELRAASGGGADAAVAAARPPVHFRRRESLIRQLRRWSEPEIRRGLDFLAETERGTRLGPLSTVLAERACLRLAHLPGRRAGNRPSA